MTEKYELSIDREIEFMLKYSLTADELFLIKLIFLAQDGHEEYLSNFFSQNKLSFDLRDILISLQEKEIINKSYKIPDKGKIFNPSNVDLNKQFLKGFLQHSEDLGMELFMNYPPFTRINGQLFSLRNITKLYKSMDDMCFNYGKSIKFDPNQHKHIMELLEYGKENNLINSGLCDFIASKKWLDLEAMRDEGMGTFNTNELV
jgi:hypothetical protein